MGREHAALDVRHLSAATSALSGVVVRVTAVAWVCVVALGCSGASAEWKVILTDASGDALPIVDVAFRDGDNGWAATSAGAFEIGEGGRLTQIPAMLSWQSSVNRVWFQDASTGFAFGARGAEDPSPGVVWRTDNGGRTWSSTTTPLHEQSVAGRLCSQDIGFAISRHEIVATRDGGQTWESAFPRAPAVTFTDIRCFDAQSLIVVGGDGLVLSSLDSGRTWRQSRVAASKPTLSRVFTSGDGAWVVGTGGFVAISSDRGVSWQQLRTPTSERLWDVEVAPADGWIVGERGTILHSRDQGRSWRSYPSPTTRDLLAVTRVASTGDVWAGGLQLTLLRLRR
jgi:photosystem II stability/assembly factor-like uncharacterized protein